MTHGCSRICPNPDLNPPILRLEAKFACKGGKGTKAKGFQTEIVDRKEDQTSIIDVVTGGGQDCAI